MDKKNVKEIDEKVDFFINILHHPDVRQPTQVFFNQLANLSESDAQEPINNSLPFFFALP